MSGATNRIAAIIDGAEAPADPLEGLVERAEKDQAAVFLPEVVERLAALRKGNRAAYELLRLKLKAVKCRVRALDETIAEMSGDRNAGREPRQAEILLDLADECELFHGPDKTGYADVRFRAPVYVGDTIACESRVIGVKENSNGKSGVVYASAGSAVAPVSRWTSHFSLPVFLSRATT